MNSEDDIEGSITQRSPLLSSGEFFFVHAGVTPWMLLIEPEQHWDALGMRGNSQLRAGIENYAHGHSLVRTPDIRRTRINIDRAVTPTAT